jgi:hypothetical protein
MQVFFLRNMISVSFAAILFSAITQSTLADLPSATKNEGNTPVESNKMQERKLELPNSKATLKEMNPSSPQAGGHDQAYNYEDMLHDDIAPMTEEENRVLQRLETLKEGAPSGEEFHGADKSEIPANTVVSAMDMEPTHVNFTPVSDDDSYPPQPKKDPNDPTQEGDRKGGKHKGIRFIPIIKMGEDYPSVDMPKLAALNINGLSK